MRHYVGNKKTIFPLFTLVTDYFTFSTQRSVFVRCHLRTIQQYYSKCNTRNFNTQTHERQNVNFSKNFI